MKIKKKIDVRTPSGEVEELRIAREKRNGEQFELKPYVDYKPTEQKLMAASDDEYWKCNCGVINAMFYPACQYCGQPKPEVYKNEINQQPQI